MRRTQGSRATNPVLPLPTNKATGTPRHEQGSTDQTLSLIKHNATDIPSDFFPRRGQDPLSRLRGMHLSDTPDVQSETFPNPTVPAQQPVQNPHYRHGHTAAVKNVSRIRSRIPRCLPTNPVPYIA